MRSLAHHLRRAALALLPLVLLTLAFFVMRHELSELHTGQLLKALKSIPASRIALSLACAVCNYLALTLYDVLALRHLGRRLPYRQVGFASFVGYAFGHNIGMSFLTGGGVRYRLYAARGLTALDVAQVGTFNVLTFWVGLLAVSGVALLVDGGQGAMSLLSLSPGMARALGLALLGVLALYFGLCLRVRQPLRVRRLDLEVSLPTPRQAFEQLVVSFTDWTLAAMVLWVLLPPDGRVSPATMVALFAVAQLAGLASQVPGGLGVFDSVILAALTPRLSTALVLGTLLVYRVIYYLIPFAVAATMLVVHEVLQRRNLLARRWPRGGHRRQEA
ncbi:lysylphosphatidylglycerol synthase domain-containing protein [Myxococcus sp. K15C18031901]|uniref:lysylphosphatidylglycerol synthase domain-containing protein n=1 Tax=Myxococcus dinghuensis TaxID=2906761 RepID=UPI0020A73DC1|nr:lysylphosphatidylglycerol synthase domain-containing protein [Myxococcus dinghuensis]MCP3104487.1 lysylphosphatidylglycerol synthase domain-containing protein [Myxococcus dinghuensis]